MLKSPVRAVFLCSVAKVRKVYSKCNKSLLSDYDGDDGYTDKCVGNRVIITNFILWNVGSCNAEDHRDVHCDHS